jgi:hypothetical protein
MDNAVMEVWVNSGRKGRKDGESGELERGEMEHGRQNLVL